MRIAIFCHSLISDWNHGNAHFLRGVVRELIVLGHRVDVYEPRNAWSVEGLIGEAGQDAVDEFTYRYPRLKPIRYDLEQIDLECALDGIDLVLVHEWNHPDLVRRVGQIRRQSRQMVALFHDTHHRAATNVAAIAEFDLRHYDGALLFGRSLAELYQSLGLVRRTWVWHEAADIRIFHPQHEVQPDSDLVWIGNWGDEERTVELREFLLRPVRSLRLRTVAYGVRYPDIALRQLKQVGIQYRGWLPNFKVPAALAASRITVHIPRMPYVRLLPGIPTIRVFEALACGTPLVCAPWEDVEGLFAPGAFQVADNFADMQSKLWVIVNDSAMAKDMVQRGLNSIRQRHTCAHRAAELLDIYNSLRVVAENTGHPLTPDVCCAPDSEKAGDASQARVLPGFVDQ
jgi:spore maturation protein CgeB